MPATNRKVLIDRRRLLAAGGAVAAAAGRRPAGRRLAGPCPAGRIPVHPRGRLRGPGARRGGAVDAAGAPAAAGRWRDADPGGAGRLAGRGRPTLRADRAPRDRPRPARPGPHRARRGRRAGAGPHLVVPVPGRRGAQPGRPHPHPARPGASPGRLALAVVSCQHYEHGYYTAYQHLAQEDLDLVLHLGDYLYETAPADGQPRRHITPAPTDLAGYRLRHALYRTDPDLQAAHAALPFVLTWDDHEVENDYAADQSERFDPPAAFRRRRAAAYRAYWEHLPLRRRSRPRGPAARLYRRLRFGDLAELAVLDTRQYRDDQPCDDNGVGRGQVVAGCAERLDPAAQPARHRAAALAAGRAGPLPCPLERDRPAAAHGRAGAPARARAWPTAATAGTAMPPTGPASFSSSRPGGRPTRSCSAGTCTRSGSTTSSWTTTGRALTVLASEFVGTSISSSGPLYEQYRCVSGRQPPRPVLREPLARLPALSGGPPTLED